MTSATFADLGRIVVIIPTFNERTTITPIVSREGAVVGLRCVAPALPLSAPPPMYTHS